MKYRVVELSIRKYLGPYTNKTMWQHVKYAIGIKKDNEIYDYKTLEKYNIIERNEEKISNICTNDLEIGRIYAIVDSSIIFSKDKCYGEKAIEKGINESPLYTYDYKKMKRKIK